MKAQPLFLQNGTYHPCLPQVATHIRLSMPCPLSDRILPVNKNGWAWNGNTEKPTLTPSILTNDGSTVCHSYITDGIVEFLTDCTHDSAGKILDLLDVD
jgi:hypothetical protein